jgi:hypothetical protein
MFAVSAITLAFGSVALADTPDTTTGAAPARDVKNEVPIVVYTYGATGAPAKTVGVEAYGLGNSGGGNRAILGGGATVWGSPVDRLTLIGDGARNAFGDFAPSAAAVVRLFGRANDGWSLGAIGKFKVDGFSMGPNHEMESEIESGLLLSYGRAGWHFDLNSITGFGTGDDGEVDTEGRLRLGRDVGNLLRVGLDGQGRYRLNGATPLLGGRTWDFAAGPQVMLGTKAFFGAITTGPATMGVANGLGWSGVVTVGGATL